MSEKIELLKKRIIEEVEKALNSESEIKKVELSDKILNIVRSMYDI